MRHQFTDNESLRFSTNNNAEVKGLSLSPFIGRGVATPRQFLFISQKSDTTMQSNKLWKFGKQGIGFVPDSEIDKIKIIG